MNSKQKGKRGENELVKILNDRFGDGRFKRTPHSGALIGGQNQSKSENLDYKVAFASDIIIPKDFNFIIEHKFYSEISFWELFSDKANWTQWTMQAKNDADFVQKKYVVIIKYNRHKRIVLIEKSFLPKEVSSNLEWRNMKNNIIYSVMEFDILLQLDDTFWFKEL